MNNIEPDFETLNAFVDGELSADERSKIEVLIATDVRIARQIKTLFDMKESVTKLASEVVLVQVPPRGLPRHVRAPFWVAAVLCLMVLGSLVWSALLSRNPAGPFAPQMIAEAIVLHDSWANGDSDATPAAEIPGFAPPELTAAGLTLASIRSNVEIAGTHAIQAGYIGRHGCKLSLFDIPDAGANDAFHITSFDNLQSAAWTSGPSRYIAIARNMDATRFAVLAGAMKAMTMQTGSPTASVIAQLDSAHQPCNG